MEGLNGGDSRPVNFYSYLLGKPQTLRGLMNYECFNICTLGHWASGTLAGEFLKKRVGRGTD